MYRAYQFCEDKRKRHGSNLFMHSIIHSCSPSLLSTKTADCLWIEKKNMSRTLLIRSSQRLFSPGSGTGDVNYSLMSTALTASCSRQKVKFPGAFPDQDFSKSMNFTWKLSEPIPQSPFSEAFVEDFSRNFRSGSFYEQLVKHEMENLRTPDSHTWRRWSSDVNSAFYKMTSDDLSFLAFLSLASSHFLLFRSAIEPKLVFVALSEPSPHTRANSACSRCGRKHSQKTRNKWENLISWMIFLMLDVIRMFRRFHFLWDAVRKLTFAELVGNFSLKHFSRSLLIMIRLALA